MQKYVLFIGIDISKHWIDVCLCHDSQKKDMPHGRFDNDDKGFHRMLRFVSDLANKKLKALISNGALVARRLEGLLCQEAQGRQVQVPRPEQRQEQAGAADFCRCQKGDALCGTWQAQGMRKTKMPRKANPFTQKNRSLVLSPSP